MRAPRLGRASAVVFGGAVIAALTAAAFFFPVETADPLRASALDIIDRMAPRAARSDRVLVVDIDRASLAAHGSWPWPRDRLAELVRAIAAARSQAIGFDMVLAGPDRASPSTIARVLAEEHGANALAASLASLPDPDAALATAISNAPVALGAVLSDLPGGSAPAAPVAIEGEPPALAPWRAAGAELPHAALAAPSVAIVSLPGSEDGRVRAVPLFVVAGDVPMAGLALETLRLAEGTSTFILSGSPPTLSVGSIERPLPRGVALPLRPSARDTWPARTVSAVALLDGKVPAERFDGRIVLVGSSAPELGSLRDTAASPLTPSVQIQADAVTQIIDGVMPLRPAWARPAEAWAALLLGAAMIAAAVVAPPVAAAAIGLILAVTWAVGAGAAYVAANLILDPITPAMTAVFGGLVAGVMAFATTRARAAAIQRRFEQHLAPAVVARIAARPELLRIDGERREVTALFTDLEGFTQTADRLDPRELVALLDAYFEGITAIVVRHGGMVDKFVGDAVHALFNAPLDLDDHARRAVLCAFEIAAFTETFRTERGAEAGVGRTRIGIETGIVVVGDVGAGHKLDYTAHGKPMNLAARLEAENKLLGTTILVGPGARARIAGLSFREHGAREIRGHGPVEIYEPLPIEG